MDRNYGLINKTIEVGLVGTGYAAKKRAEAFVNNPLSKLVAVVGNSVERTQEFCQTFEIPSVSSWQKLVNNPDIDLICVCNINRDHGTIVKGALLAGKHVIVEYPLTTNPQEASELIELAQKKRLLLHVEHIEIIGGVHQAIKQNLDRIGTPFLANYSTIMVKRKTAPHWTYSYQDYGFPLIAALSRINRFTDLFGEVDKVSCFARFWDAPQAGYFSACYCQAQLKFANQMMVSLTYGKGEQFQISDRTLEIHGDEGTLKFIGEKGQIIRGKEILPIEVGSRRGLFNRDTQIVLEHLTKGIPLYIKNAQSAYSLRVAGAAFEAYQHHKIINNAQIYNQHSAGIIAKNN